MFAEIIFNWCKTKCNSIDPKRPDLIEAALVSDIYGPNLFARHIMFNEYSVALVINAGPSLASYATKKLKLNFVAFSPQANYTDRLCGLVVTVPGYRSRGPGFDSRRHQIFWEVVFLERGPLSLVRIIEELLGWKNSFSGQENRINDRGDPLRWPRTTLYPQKLALTSPTSGGRSVDLNCMLLWLIDMN
jgi:hypothetical protein